MTRRATGPSDEVRSLVLSRARYLCEVCGTRPATNIHHRKPRRMGGTRDPRINSPANLLALCGSGTQGCHGMIESRRTFAQYAGWLLSHGDEPAGVPVLGPRDTWWTLDVEGSKRPTSPPG